MAHLELLHESPVIVPRHPGGRLVVVSNRLPALSDAPAAGGLAIALESVLKAEGGGLWFGWSGEVSKDGEPIPRTSAYRGIAFAVSDLSRRDIEEYYYGFANRALWPVCHYRLDLAKLSDANAASYFRVNAQFACQLHKMLRREDVVWVHDYHLIPIASFLRKLGCFNRIGFFLHIPWPGPEVASLCRTMNSSFAPLALMTSPAFKPRQMQAIFAPVSQVPEPDGASTVIGARLAAAGFRSAPFQSASIAGLLPS